MLPALGTDAPEHIRGVRLLGRDADVEWTQTAEGLKVALPREMAGGHGYALAIELGSAASVSD